MGDILATGPLTNIAETVLVLAQLKKQHLLERIGKIYTCGGVRHFGQIFFFGTKQPVPFSDMNFDYDPMSVLILLQHKLDVVFAGFEVAVKYWMKEKYLDKLSEIGDAVTKKFVNCESLRDEVARWKSWGNIWKQDEPGNEAEGRKQHDTGVPIEGVCPSDLFPAMFMISRIICCLSTECILWN